MQDKYTIRDFLVYFLTGLFLLLTLLNKFNHSLLDYFTITKTDIKDNSAVTIFLLIPGLYILGHTVHGLDLATFKFGRLLWDFKVKHESKLKKFKVLWLFNRVNILVNGNKVTGILNSKNIKSKIFWKKATRIQYEGKFDKLEYWLLMNDLFKGLSLISLGWTLFYSFKFSTIEFFFYCSLTVLFWYRARHFATNFVTTVNHTFDIATEITNANSKQA
jgi:hypothetical protein